MFAKESLYINAVKYKAQIKINYKKLSNDEIIETNSSTFIAKDDIMGRDIATKLNNHASEIDQTYISTLLVNEESKLFKKNKPLPNSYITTSLNNEYNVAISKESLFETRNYFQKTGVDYIFSAYHLLNLHIEQNPCQNNLVILLFNNQAFCVILNSKSEIVFNKSVHLTPFEEVKDSSFYENDVLGQKLYDEVYSLEIRELIKSTIEEFYTITKNVFIEKVSLLYDLKLISDDLVQDMSDEFMLDIQYHPISIDEELFELSKNSHIKKSFVRARPKPNNRFKNLVLVLLIIILLLAIGYFFISFYENIKIKKENIVKQELQKKVVEKKIELPNHILKNKAIENRVLKSFNLIPYDVVLNELDLEKNSEKMDINILHKDTYIKGLEPELIKTYDKNKIEYKEESKKHIYEAIISSEGLKAKKEIPFVDYKDIYVENEFIPIIRVTEQIKMLFPKDATVTFKSSFKSKVVTFNYLINFVVKKPSEFFSVIDGLNNELYSINITYPLSFTKTDAGIEIEFTLQFHQPK